MRMLYNLFTIIKYFLQIMIFIAVIAFVFIEMSTTLASAIAGLLAVYGAVAYIAYRLQNDKMTVKWVQRKNLATHQRYYKLFLASCTGILFILTMYSAGLDRNGASNTVLFLLMLICAFLFMKQLKKEQ